MSETTPREALHAAIQTTAAKQDDLEGSALVGWVLVAEWMDGEGKKWLSRITGDPNGNAGPEWQIQGYLHNALFHDDDFDDIETDEDGDDV